MEKYSYSRLETFDKCKLQYKFNYIDRLENKFEGIEAYMGSRVHETLELLYKDYNYKKFPLVEDLLLYYSENWEKQYKNKVMMINNKKHTTPDYYHDLGKKLLENYYKLNWPFYKDDTLVGIEKKIDFCLDNESKYSFTGKIDRVHYREDNVFEIHDYKTGKTKYTQSAIDNDIQLAIYEAGLRKELNDNESGFELYWHFLVHKEDFKSVRTKEQIYNLIQNTIKRIETIEQTKDFPATFGYLCDWCSYKFNCDTYIEEKNLKDKKVFFVQTKNKTEDEKLVEEYLNAVDDYKRIKETGVLIKKSVIRRNDIIKGKDKSLVVVDDVKIDIKDKKGLVKYLINKDKISLFDISENNLRELLRDDKKIKDYITVQETKKIKVIENEKNKNNDDDVPW